jgi:hypothetical protein
MGPTVTACLADELVANRRRAAIGPAESGARGAVEASRDLHQI